MRKEVNNENRNICRNCGGKCCKRCGCDYSAYDFKNCSYDNLFYELSKGDKSIVCYMKFIEDVFGKVKCKPFLSIRARNNNRGIVDLISMETGCALLRSDGCPYDYEHRPAVGRNLNPVDPTLGSCEPIKNPLSILRSWRKHQKKLRKLVLNITGMSVEQKISEDVENLFYDVLSESFDGMSVFELENIKWLVSLFSKAFPEELELANLRYNKSKSKVLVKN